MLYICLLNYFSKFSVRYVYRTPTKLYGDEKVVRYKDILLFDIMKLVALLQTGTGFVIVYWYLCYKAAWNNELKDNA